MPDRRNHDHRIRDAIVATGDVELFPELDIPRSTAKTGIRRGRREAVGVEASDIDLVRE